MKVLSNSSKTFAPDTHHENKETQKCKIQSWIITINYWIHKEPDKDNRPFYSCVVSCLAFEWKWLAKGDLALLETSLLRLCQWCCSHAN